MRIGTKKIPFYRVVVVDERAKRTGAYIELVGTYNPLTQPKDIKLEQKRIDYWIKQGAQPSVGFLRIIGKAPQRLPRKPKKEKKESSAISPQPSDKPAETAKEEKQEVINQKTEENSEDQKTSESEPSQTWSENQKSDSSDTSGTQSPSESSEQKP